MYMVNEQCKAGYTLVTITQVSESSPLPPNTSSPKAELIALFRALQASLVAQMVNNPPVMRKTQLRSLDWEDPLEDMATHSSILPGEFHGQRSVAGYSPWGCKELDMTE